MALVLGIYPRLLAALGNVDMVAALSLWRALTLRPNGWAGLRDSLRRLDAGFLAWLGFGALSAVFSLSRLMMFLLHHHLTETYAFFFGLILVSMIIPYRLLRRRSGVALAVCLIAAAATVVVTVSAESGAMAKAERKASLQAQRLAAAPSAAEPVAREVAAPRLLIRWPAMAEVARFFCGAALAVAAMILPGISGSFVLLLTGIYFDLLRAVTERDLLLLGVFMVGGVFGLLGLARVVDACLRRRFDITMAGMIGLMLGSLWGLWPFKSWVIVGGDLIILGNRWPTQASEYLPATMMFLIAAAVVLGFLGLERRTGGGPTTPEVAGP